MSLRLVGALLALAWLASASAQAQGAFLHIVGEGDTLASIAQQYYGDPSLALVLASENRVQQEAPLLSGTKILVPYTWQHRVAEGDTWKSIAARYYGTEDRAFVLVQENNSVRRRTLDVGAILKVPYAVRATVGRGESANDVAKRLGVTRARDRRWVGKFNPNVRFSNGEQVLVPLATLSLSEQGRDAAIRLSGVDVAGNERQRQLAASKSLLRLRDYVSEGAFPEILALGNGLLGGGSLTDSQKLTVLQALATAYVGFGRRDLATKAFIAALAIEPTLELDAVDTSPKINKAFEAAKKAR